MWLTRDFWNMGLMMFGVIGCGVLMAGALVFIEWWFHRRGKDE